MKNVSAQDLRNLKQSVPVPITAHSHELICPVVYATKVRKYMEKEGMHLPLTQKELQAYKEKAKEYAKGGVVAVTKGGITQQVVVNIGHTRRRRKKKKKTMGMAGGPAMPPRAMSTWSSLPPSNFGSLSWDSIKSRLGPLDTGLRPTPETMNAVDKYKTDLQQLQKEQKELMEKFQRQLSTPLRSSAATERTTIYASGPLTSRPKAESAGLTPDPLRVDTAARDIFARAGLDVDETGEEKEAPVPRKMVRERAEMSKQQGNILDPGTTRMKPRLPPLRR